MGRTFKESYSGSKQEIMAKEHAKKKKRKGHAKLEPYTRNKGNNFEN